MNDEPLIKEIDYRIKDMIIKLNSECRRCDERIFCMGCKYHYIKKELMRIEHEYF